MTTQSYGAESATNGNRQQAAVATSQDIQQDFRALQQDVAKLSEQLAGLVATKGSEAWTLAKDNIDGLLTAAGSKGKEASDAVGEIRDNLAVAIEESIEHRPYTTLALTLAAGFVAGAMWKR
jgi:ElaB/YqjD/DUF883 family membrane-anchored ribosome-binding protein